jgi:2-polyprenyl-3-methyl-5-hydroxy-6-metoxy-1,4-benzoquinol methylase
MIIKTDKNCIELKQQRFKFSGYTFREDTYGVIKRLEFFIEQIEDIRSRIGLDINEVRILDVGCGTGINVTIPLAIYGYDVTGIDVNKASIDRGTSLTEDMQNVTFRCQTLKEFMANEKFHIIICSEIMEHLEQPEELLEEVSGLLDDAGDFLVTVPNGYGYFEFESSIEERYPNLVYKIDSYVQPLTRGFFKLISQSLRERHWLERSKEYCDISITSMDEETEHCNKFTKSSIIKLLEANRFDIKDFKNRTFLSGNIINVLIRECNFILKCNSFVANYLPSWMCSGWMISAKKIV